MKQLIYRFIRYVSRQCHMNIMVIIKEKCNALRSEWIAARMAECGQGVFFSKIGKLHSP